jgi:hypothetical protein
MGNATPRKPQLRARNEGGPPFDAGFFATAFRERVGALCKERPGDATLVLVQLADGRVLDLCHIELLTPRWMMAAVFREGSDCKEMDTALVPYELVTRLTLSRRKASAKRLGFQLEKSAAAISSETGGRKDAP